VHLFEVSLLLIASQSVHVLDAVDVGLCCCCYIRVWCKFYLLVSARCSREFNPIGVFHV